MKAYFLKLKEYVLDHKKEFSRGAIVVGAIVVVFGGLALYSYNTAQPKIVYEPANACDLLTLTEAKTLLGDKTINGINETPVQSGVAAVSKCGYSDGLPDTSNAVVAAIVVRSGINDEGVSLNEKQFEAGKPTGVQDISGIGDKAYFNAGLGQLNVLKESTWIIISYGAGSSPTTNTLEDTEKVAKLVLNAQ